MPQTRPNRVLLREKKAGVCCLTIFLATIEIGRRISLSVFREMFMIIRFCEIHFAEGLGYSLMANSEHLSREGV